MRPIDSVRANSSKFEALAEQARKKLRQSTSSPLEAATGTGEADLERAMETVLHGGESPLEGRGFQFNSALEAIILAELRPAYFIRNDKIEIAGEYDHVGLIESNKATLEAVSTRVGAVEILNHASMTYIGTGWLIEKDIVVTNRHVADAFAENDWPAGWRFKPIGYRGRPLLTELNPGRQDGSAPFAPATLMATEVLFVAGPREPDIAFLRVRNPENWEPVPLSTAPVEFGLPIAAVGYPAADEQRNDPAMMDDIFGGTYEVKRFSPGLANALTHGGVIVESDYSTLGGNSGSAVLDLASGEAIALHFAGIFQETNFAVAADIVAATLRSAVKGPVVAGMSGLPDAAERLAPSHFAGRDGYLSDFLGGDDLAVPLPDLGARAGDVAPVEGADDDILRYTHFSVIQSRSRRLPILTAVNIDGARAFQLKRKGSWHTDGRVAKEHQADNVLYKHNPLDRGHMVRRKDPGWGDSKAEAQQGEIDTFVYTNCAPQHEDLNQKDWVGLEDYILEAADTRDFKVSVLTGPVLDDEADRTLKVQPGAEDIQIPGAFWKVAVMVHAHTGALSATAYLLTQGDMIRDITEAAFVLGEYKTYQVKIEKIEALTGFDFGALRQHDPMAAEPEGVFGRDVVPITGPGTPILAVGGSRRFGNSEN